MVAFAVEKSIQDFCESEDMATAAELTAKFATLEERVANNIKFFWVVVGFGIVWLCSLSLILFNMNGTLKSIESQQAKTTIASHSALNKESFKETLPDLGPAIEIARKRKVLVSPDLVKSVRDQLIATDHSAPGFWRAASELISYQYRESKTGLPECGSTIPEHLYWARVDHPEIKGDPPPDQLKFSNCHLNLNLALPASILSSTHTADAVVIVCEHCNVTYSGGAVPLLSAKATVYINFTDCAFDVSASEISPNRGKRLITTVLTTNNTRDIAYKDPDVAPA